MCGRWGEGTLCLGLKPLFLSLPPLGRATTTKSRPFYWGYGFHAIRLGLEMWRKTALHLDLGVLWDSC